MLKRIIASLLCIALFLCALAVVVGGTLILRGRRAERRRFRRWRRSGASTPHAARRSQGWRKNTARLPYLGAWRARRYSASASAYGRFVFMGT